MDIVRAVEWREIPGWDGYRVSNKGVVQSCKGPGPQGILPGQWRDLKPRPAKNGYLYVNPSQNGKAVNVAVHHMVLIAFGFARPDGMEARHANGNRQDNRLENLSWSTHIENERDKIWHGTRRFGESHGCSKLTEDDVQAIVEGIDVHHRSFRQLASEYGVTDGTIQHIAYAKTWKSITEPGLKARLASFRAKKSAAMVTAFGESKSTLEWSRDHRCTTTHGCIRTRLSKGMSPEQAITTPRYAVKH